MKKVIMFLLAVVLMVGVSQAAFKETITVSSTAIGPTASTITQPNFNAKYAFCTVATDSIRLWYDGSTPTATVGHLIAADSWFTVTGVANVKNLLMIRATTDATVSCSYE